MPGRLAGCVVVEAMIGEVPPALRYAPASGQKGQVSVAFCAGTAFFATGAVAVAKTAPEKNGAYAEEACKTGCFVAQAGVKFYHGAMAQSYRVCPLDVYDSKVVVDGVTLPISGMRFGVRHCVDVSGKELVALEHDVAVGRLPN